MRGRATVRPKKSRVMTSIPPAIATTTSLFLLTPAGSVLSGRGPVIHPGGEGLRRRGARLAQHQPGRGAGVRELRRGGRVGPALAGAAGGRALGRLALAQRIRRPRRVARGG